MTDGASSLGFPDVPRSKLDRVLSDLVETAQDVLTTQGRLRSLLNATRSVSGELELPAVLQRIVEGAVDLVGARYGAIGVIAPDGSLEQFIHVGMPESLVQQIGALPTGHGVLGALIDEQAPIRLEHLSDDPRSSGFPAHHPPMDSFLGVPIRVRDEVYGNLYLSESRVGAFTEEDQELLVALAATAGAAIDHARLFDESRRRQRWATASAEVTSALLSEQLEDSLTILTERVTSLAAADLVCVAMPVDDHTMGVTVACGSLAPQFADIRFASGSTLAGRALESGQPILSEVTIDGRMNPAVAIGPTMAVPLISSDEPSGVLLVARSPGSARFTTADLDMAADFAAQATLAIRIAHGRTDRQRLALLEDRERIARDLHDHVIQHLFAAGLRLQAIADTVGDLPARSAILEQVDALDTTIAEIRTAIFTLTTNADADTPSVRHQVIEVLGEMAATFAEPPRLTFSGAVDLMVPTTMVDDLVAVVREGLANIAKHAHASDTAVSIGVAGDTLTVVIEDDGDGIGHGRSHVMGGTVNLGARAAKRGGSFQVLPRAPRGTTLQWTVPIPDAVSAK